MHDQVLLARKLQPLFTSDKLLLDTKKMLKKYISSNIQGRLYSHGATVPNLRFSGLLASSFTFDSHERHKSLFLAKRN